MSTATLRIAILSRNRNLHSIRRLLAEARRVRLHCDVINPVDCQVVVGQRDSCILYRLNPGAHPVPLPHYDAVLPRIGASITDYGLAVVRQFEAMHMRTINSADAIAESRDKLRSLQVMSGAGIAVPSTVLTRGTRNLPAAVEVVKGMPVVLKLLKGTQGVGVMLVHSTVSLGSVMETLRGLDRDSIIQQFIAEGAGRDYRAFVVGKRVVAAMLRTAAEGEFRSNIHRGGAGRLVRLPKSFENAAIKAAEVLGLEVAGVDIMESVAGPLVLEVNSSPGFEGIEKATGLNIAREIVQHIVRVARASRKRTQARKKSPPQKRKARPKKGSRR